jgi:hypothetical protein
LPLKLLEFCIGLWNRADGICVISAKQIRRVSNAVAVSFYPLETEESSLSLTQEMGGRP